MLAVDPADVTKTIDRPVLYDPESDDDAGSEKPGPVAST
jgi:hypothetical protein